MMGAEFNPDATLDTSQVTTPHDPSSFWTWYDGHELLMMLLIPVVAYLIVSYANGILACRACQHHTNGRRVTSTSSDRSR